MRKVLQVEFNVSEDSSGYHSWHKIPDSQEVRRLRGEMFGIVNLGDSQTAETWRKVFEEAYFSILAGSSLGILAQAWAKANEAIKNTVSGSVVILWGEVVYLVFAGKGWAGLIRNGNYFSLGGGTNGEPATVSGYCRTGDLITMEVGSFVNLTPDQKMGIFTQGKKPEEFAGTWGTIRFTQREVPSEDEIIRIVPDSQPASGTETIFPKLQGQIFGERTRGKLIKLAVFALVGATLLGGSIFLVRRGDQGYRRAISEVEKKERAALELVGINNDLARQGLEEARGMLVKLKSSSEVEKISARLDEAIKRTENKIVIGELPVFYDLNLLKPGASASLGDIDGDQLYLADSNMGIVLKVNSKNKSGQVLFSGDEFRESVAMAVADGVVFTLGPKGVYRGKKLVIPTDRNWVKPSGLAVYSGNVYVADGGIGQIWKYSSTSSGYGLAKKYFSEETPEISAVFIDGSVNIFGTAGFGRYSVGHKDSVSLSGYPPEFGRVEQIFVGSSGRVYLWDRSNSSLIIFSGEGRYEKLFKIPQKEVKLVLVNEEQKKVFLILGSKIEEFVLEY